MRADAMQDDMRDEKWQFLLSFLNASNASIVIADARAPDFPIVFVNPTFERITGYTRAETLGRNCRFLQHDLINAQEAERKAVARELHDELGQRLTALNMLLHRSRPVYQSGDAGPLWCQAEQELASLVELVRHMSVSLRPPGLDYFGLEPTIRELLTRQFSQGPTWVFEYAGLPRRLAPEIESTVFRIVQESVTNIQRHARARHAVVEINGGAAGMELELIVRDDGRGFDPSRQAELAHAGRSGLSGMRERAGLLGGAFEVDSRPGGGTRIVVTLPLAPRETR